jgi:MFS family permease
MAWSVGLILFSQSRIFWFSVVVLFFVGFSATVQMAATNTIVQRRVPDELRSRVMAVYATMFMGVQPIGALLAGLVAKRIGAPLTLGIFGSVLAVAAIIFFVRTVLPMEAQRAAAEAQAGLGR